jgi:hypothetical protein
MSIVITAFEVPRLDAFVPVEVPSCSHVVHRAISDDATFGYFDVATCDSTEVAADLVSALRSGPVPVRTGRYEVLHANDRPAAPFASDGSADEVAFINCFEVEQGGEDAAFAAWQRVNGYMVTKPGYRSHTLHRRVGDAAFGLVNVVLWESVEAWQAAHDQGFRDIVAGPQPFVSLPTLCRPVLTACEANR